VGRGGFIGIIGVVIYLMPGTSQPKLHSVSKFKFRITYPQTGSVQTMFNGFFDISGTYMKDPPEGYSVAIIELIEPSGFAFRRNVILDTQNKTWQAKAVWGGTEQNRSKEFAIVVVGPSGKALWDYWEKVGREHNWEIPPIETRPADILSCDRVQIVARQ